jgi:hypothetical protein
VMCNMDPSKTARAHHGPQLKIMEATILKPHLQQPFTSTNFMNNYYMFHYSFDGRYFKKFIRIFLHMYVYIYILGLRLNKLYGNFTSYMLLRIWGCLKKLMTTCYLPTIMSIFSCSSWWCLKTGCPDLWTKQFGEHRFWTFLNTWSL